MKQTFVAHNHEEFMARLRNLDDPAEYPVRVTVDKHKANRTLAQNRLMWMWMTEISKGYYLSGGELFEPKVWKYWFQNRFLGTKVMEGPRNDVLVVPITTSELDTKEFTEFLAQVECYAVDELEIELTRPDDLYVEAILGEQVHRERKGADVPDQDTRGMQPQP